MYIHIVFYRWMDDPVPAGWLRVLFANHLVRSLITSSFRVVSLRFFSPLPPHFIFLCISIDTTNKRRRGGGREEWEHDVELGTISHSAFQLVRPTAILRVLTFLQPFVSFPCLYFYYRYYLYSNDFRQTTETLQSPPPEKREGNERTPRPPPPSKREKFR